MKELFKAIGMKNYIVYLFLLILEILINLPFNIIKAILYPFYYIYTKYFDTEYFFPLTKIKKVNLYGQELQKKVKDYQKSQEIKIDKEDVILPSKFNKKRGKER